MFYNYSHFALVAAAKANKFTTVTDNVAKMNNHQIDHGHSNHLPYELIEPRPCDILVCVERESRE